MLKTDSNNNKMTANYLDANKIKLNNIEFKTNQMIIEKESINTSKLSGNLKFRITTKSYNK
jgi:hypothetical protein